MSSTKAIQAKETDEHHQARDRQLRDAAPELTGRADEIGEGDPGNDEIGGERLRVEGEPDEHAAPHQRAPASGFARAQPGAAGERRISRISSGSTPFSRETATNDGNTASVSAPANAATAPRRRASRR